MHFFISFALDTERGHKKMITFVLKLDIKGIKGIAGEYQVRDKQNLNQVV